MRNLTFLFIFFIAAAFAQNDFRIERLPLNNGLPHNLTYALIQDSKGFIWIGTMHGLAKYDGINYQLFRHNPKDSTSISFDDIISLYEDRDGYLWIGTWGGGLNRYNRADGSFERFIHNPQNPNSINDNIVWAVTEDTSGNIWLGTETGGISKFNKKSKTFSSYNLVSDSLPSPRIQSIQADNKNNIWIGSSRGLFVMEDRNSNPIKIEAFNNNFIADIKFKNKSTLIAAYGNNLAEYSIEKNSIQKIDLSKFKEWNPKVFINQIVYDDKDDLWIATYHGLFTLDSGRTGLKKISNEPGNNKSLYSSNINKILIDQSGVIWVSIYNSGLNKVIDAPKNFTNIIINSAIKSLVEKENNIWITTMGAGIYRLDSLNNINQYISENKNENYIFSSINYDRKNILLSTQAGLRLFDVKTKKLKEFNKDKLLYRMPIGSFLNTSKFIYGGTYGNGLIIIDKSTGEVSRELFDEKLKSSQTVNYILSILPSADGIYLGTYGGLIKIDDKNNLHLFSHSDDDQKSISHNYVFSIAELNDNKLVVGTSNGLNIFNKNTGEFVKYFEENGLPNNVINAIIKIDQKNVWLSTNNGITNFNPLKNDFKNYNNLDGLHTDLFLAKSFLKMTDGRIIFGTQEGIVLFDPEKIYLSNYNPNIAVTKIIQTDEEEAVILGFDNRSLSFPYDNNSFEFHFASLDFINPEKIKYKYFLEGFDEEWIESGNNSFAIYKNLPSGKYNFKVMGTNSSGIWSTNSASIEFVINPPFYLTWWFVLLFTVVFLFLILGVYRYNLNRKIKYAVAAEKIKSDEREKVRRKTAIDFHDELGHVLTRINLLVELVSRKIPEDDKILRPMLNKISQNSFRLYNGTKDFIWSIDPQNDNLYELLIRLKDFGDEIFMDTEIFFEVNGLTEKYKDLKLTTDWRRHLALIFKEGMTNILKYSRSKKVSLSTIFRNDELKIALEDDGEGFIIPAEHKGNGLKNMKKRAEKLNSVLNINSNIGEGTKILFKGKISSGEFHLN